MLAWNLRVEQGIISSLGCQVVQKTLRGEKCMSEYQPHQSPASSSTTSAVDTAQQRAPETTAKAQEIGDRVQHEAQRLTQEAKAQGQALFQDQKDAMAEQVNGLATALHRTAEELQTQNQSAMAQYTQQAAEGIERFSRTLKDRDMSALVGQVESFARNQPGAFIGSAALLGFMAARFLKSSAERHHTPSAHSQASYDHPGQPTPPPSVHGATSADVVTPESIAPRGDHSPTRPATTPPMTPPSSAHGATSADVVTPESISPRGDHSPTRPTTTPPATSPSSAHGAASSDVVTPTSTSPKGDK
jgi:hypothetical protein